MKKAPESTAESKVIACNATVGELIYW